MRPEFNLFQSKRTLLNTDYMSDIATNATKCFLVGWLLSNCYDDKDHLTLAKQYYEKAEKMGHVPARFNLGLMIQTGVFPKMSKKKGFDYIQSSADQHYARAWATLGFYYSKGDVVRRDIHQAEACHQKAIDLGHTVAACNLAYLYLFDKAYSANQKQKLHLVMRYLTQGEQVGHIGSLYILGRIYQTGLAHDGKPDMKKALALYKHAAKQGHYASAATLAAYYKEKLQKLMMPLMQQDKKNIGLDTLPSEEVVTKLLDKIEHFDDLYKKASSKRQSPLNQYRAYQAHIVIGGYEFRDTWHFISAITRSSFIKYHLLPPIFQQKIKSGDHLEWSGDAILGTAVRARLINLYPNRDRGTLNLLYQGYVCNSSSVHEFGGPLYRIAKALRLQPLLLMGSDDGFRVYSQRGKHSKKHTIEMQLSNHVEMLIGAIALDSSDAAAQKFVEQHCAFLGLNSDEASEEDYGLSDDECFDVRVNF